MKNLNTQANHIIPETFMLVIILSSRLLFIWEFTAAEMLSISASWGTSPRWSFVRFIPFLIIHGSKTFRPVLAVSYLISSCFSARKGYFDLSKLAIDIAHEWSKPCKWPMLEETCICPQFVTKFEKLHPESLLW